MSRAIIFCADGTWNSPGQVEAGTVVGDPTNVYKIFMNFAGVLSPDQINLKDEQEKSTKDGLQLAKYIHGVGDSDNILVKLLGGAIGAGVVARIIRGFTYISRNYRNGDKIYIIGFSRGAYTARALAGLIASVGLMDAQAINLDDKAAAYRYGGAVWYAYRKAHAVQAPDLLNQLQTIIADLPGFFINGSQPPMIPNVPISAVAVWDTVGALGIPEFAAGEIPVDVFQFANNELSAKIARGIHFVAIDEQRKDFLPTLWTPDPNRIEQILYPGAHADVGGGYPTTNNESGLSDYSLMDMQTELAALGIKFADPSVITLTPDARGPAHRPWLYSPFKYLPRVDARLSLVGLPKSRSCDERLAGGPVVPDPGTPAEPYAPTNI